MNRCSRCVGEVRLGAFKVKVNRKTGIIHYVAHLSGAEGCTAADGYTCYAGKPYPTPRPYELLMQRWDHDNETALVNNGEPDGGHPAADD